MTDQLVACKTCGCVFVKRTANNSDKCLNCGDKGNQIQYENGDTSRANWWERVDQ